MKIKKLSTKLIIILTVFFTSFCNVPVSAEELEEDKTNDTEEIIAENQTDESNGQETLIEIEIVKTDGNEETVNEEETVEEKEVIAEKEETDSESLAESEYIADENDNTEPEQDSFSDASPAVDCADDNGDIVLLTNSNGSGQDKSILSDLIKDAQKVEDTPNEVSLYILDSSDEGGSDTYRSFVYTVTDEEGNINYYKGYLYGDGVDDATCLQFVLAAADGSGSDQIITDDDFVDANKSSVVVYDEEGNPEYDYNEEYDSEHCWLKASADILELTGWMKYADAGIFNTKDEDGFLNAGSYFEDEDDIADYLSYCFANYGGFHSSCFNWLFNGDALGCAESLKYGEDSNDALLSNYYQDDVFFSYFNDDEDIGNDNFNIKFNENLSDLYENNGSIGLGVYFANYDNYGEYEIYGGHAITLNGYIYQCSENDDETIDYTLSKIIISDPDDTVYDGPEDPAEKEKNYLLSSISVIDEDNFFYVLYNMKNYGEPDDTAIAYIVYLNNAKNLVTLKDGQIMLIKYDDNGSYYDEPNSSIVPTSTTALKDDYYTGSSYEVEDSLNIGLNYDFLSFYDIDDIKYELKDADGNTIKTGTFAYSKATWNSLLDSDSDFSLDFTDIIDDVGAGTYNLELTIDQDCFYGNYGWFAKKSNYYDSLADILINMHHKRVINNNYSNSSDSEDNISEVVTADINKVIINSIKVISPTETLIKNSDGTYNRQITNSVNSKIQVSSSVSLIPTGTVFNQELLSENSKEYETIRKVLDTDAQTDTNKINEFFVYNLGLTQSDGTEIHELDGYVEVSLPVPSDINLGTNKRIVTYRVNDDLSLTKCDTKVVNNIIKFRTDHFSTYVFAVEEYKAPLTGVKATDSLFNAEMFSQFENRNLKVLSELVWCLWEK